MADNELQYRKLNNRALNTLTLQPFTWVKPPILPYTKRMLILYGKSFNLSASLPCFSDTQFTVGLLQVAPCCPHLCSMVISPTGRWYTADPSKL